MTNEASILSEVLELFANTPRLQLLFLGLLATTWLIGGNVVVAMHYRRVGKPWWSGFRPFAFPFRDFNAREWLALSGLAIIAMMFGAIAVSLNPQSCKPSNSRLQRPAASGEMTGAAVVVPSSDAAAAEPPSR